MKLFLFIIGFTLALAGNGTYLFKMVNDQFTAKMFKEVLKMNEGKNVVLSAFSVLPPLALLSQGSSGPSHDELLNAIGLPSDATIMAVFKNFNQQLDAVRGVTLVRASRIYLAKDAKLNKEFKAMSREIFDSDSLNIDFSNNVKSANAINAWVEAHTSNKIKDLVRPSDFDSTTRSVLVNAFYFKGFWKDKFNIDYTIDKDFHVSKTKTVKVPIMQRTGNYTYAESSELDAKLLEMPYEGDEATFLIVLPNDIDGLTNLEKKIRSPSMLNKAIGDMSVNTVELSMPRFKIETKTILNDVLKKMNVTKLFDPSQAKLDKMLDNHVSMSVSKAIQKTFIEVTEEGTEAAAANAFIILGSSKPDPKLKIFEVDRPFYFEVRLRNTPLFNGVVVTP